MENPIKMDDLWGFFPLFLVKHLFMHLNVHTTDGCTFLWGALLRRWSVTLMASCTAITVRHFLGIPQISRMKQRSNHLCLLRII